MEKQPNQLDQSQIDQWLSEGRDMGLEGRDLEDFIMRKETEATGRNFPELIPGTVPGPTPGIKSTPESRAAGEG